MKHTTKILALAATSLLGSSLAQAKQKNTERPNILWLSFEDTSDYEFGCYGNNAVSTPHIDTLASRGIQFMNAWSCAPQSSPARSSLITGCYAPTYGMDIHPVPQITPQDIFFPDLMRQAGYYCTNNSKTHYNSTTDNKSCWDECNIRASYSSPERKEGQPFFAVYNSVSSHMGRVRTFHTDGRRDYTLEGIYPEKLVLPPHVPDLPAVRSDFAGHLEAVQDVDTWVGLFLKDLREKGLDENTIIFVFSDHGGCLPRGKGYLYETGLRVPMVVYLPEKWQHLAPKGVKFQEGSLVNFTDLAPTVLSLAGIKTPKHMHGKALLGKYADTRERKVQFAFAANHLHHFTPVRAATDGRFKYIRSYIPYKQFALRNYYQWGMPSNKAWDNFVLGHHNTNPDWAQPFEAHAAEMLFDLQNDPFELNDLSGDPAYAAPLEKLRTATSRQMRETKDLGFFTPAFREGRNMYQWVRSSRFPLDELYTLVEKAGNPSASDVAFLTQNLSHKDPNFRFWAAVGMGQLARTGQAKGCPDALKILIDDTDVYTAAEAAYACTYLGEPALGIEHLVTPKNDSLYKMGYSLLECLSLEEPMRPLILPYADKLQWAGENLPAVDNEDAGLMARGILVNLGWMDIRDLHGADSYQRGLELNHGRRPMVPLPEGAPAKNNKK